MTDPSAQQAAFGRWRREQHQAWEQRTGQPATTRTRAWDLRPGDVLFPVGFTVQSVQIDPPGRGGRRVHITHELGSFDLQLGAFVTIQGRRPTALWD